MGVKVWLAAAYLAWHSLLPGNLLVVAQSPDVVDPVVSAESVIHDVNDAESEVQQQLEEQRSEQKPRKSPQRPHHPVDPVEVQKALDGAATLQSIQAKLEEKAEARRLVTAKKDEEDSDYGEKMRLAREDAMQRVAAAKKRAARLKEERRLREKAEEEAAAAAQAQQDAAAAAADVADAVAYAHGDGNGRNEADAEVQACTSPDSASGGSGADRASCSAPPLQATRDENVQTNDQVTIEATVSGSGSGGNGGGDDSSNDDEDDDNEAAAAEGTLSGSLISALQQEAWKPRRGTDLHTESFEAALAQVVGLRKLARAVLRSVGRLEKPAEAQTGVVGVDQQQQHAGGDGDVDCGQFLQCDECYAAKCAWCLGERVCVPDEVWMCQGMEDTVGVKHGAHQTCPTAEEQEARRLSRLAAAEEADRRDAENKRRRAEAAERAERGEYVSASEETADEVGCMGWRQTGGCTPTGPREPAMDLPCDAPVPHGSSGYCECTDGQQAARSECDHDSFTCEEECASLPMKKKEAEAAFAASLEQLKRQELERVKQELLAQEQAEKEDEEEEEQDGKDATSEASQSTDKPKKSKRTLSPEEARARAERWEDIRMRAQRAAKGMGGATHPYVVFGLDEDATQSEIRRAYRVLSLRLHPDKNNQNPQVESDAQDAFADLVAAYQVLNDPEKRAAFDDYGGREGFNTQYEYEQYGKRDTRGFYAGSTLITNLSEKLWDRRIKANSVWIVEFYAAWCTACQRFVPEFKKLAQQLKHDNIEIGAVNCEVEKKLCNQIFNIRAFPTIRIINKRHGTQQEFLERSKNAPAMAKWARDVQSEWAWLFGHANLVELNAEDWQDEDKGKILSSQEFWVVLFTDGLECGSCKSAKTNMLRLSAGLRATARVGFINCEGDNRQFCADFGGMPQPPHAPQVKAWRVGNKTAEDKGEVLYNPNEIEPHYALQLIERVVRLARSDQVEEGAVSVGKEAGWDEGEKPEPPPPPPPPMWNGPKGRAPLNAIQSHTKTRRAIGN